MAAPRRAWIPMPDRADIHEYPVWMQGIMLRLGTMVYYASITEFFSISPHLSSILFVPDLSEMSGLFKTKFLMKRMLASFGKCDDSHQGMENPDFTNYQATPLIVFADAPAKMPLIDVDRYLGHISIARSILHRLA